MATTQNPKPAATADALVAVPAAEPAAVGQEEAKSESLAAGSATAPPAATPAGAAPATDDDVSAMSSAKPSDADLEAALKLDVRDRDNKKIPLGSLVQGDAETPRVIAVFIRHFFCGLCQDYLRALRDQLPPATLAGLTPATKLVVIGHGEASLIKRYTKETECPFEIYADPTRKVYDRLGFVSNLTQAKQAPKYFQRSIFRSVLSSVRQQVSSGLDMFGGGRISQNGGEAVFTNGRLGFFHRMQNTQDHTEVGDLEKVIKF